MLIREFAEDDPLRVKLIGVTSQLKARMADTAAKKKLNTNALIALLRDNDINVSKANLFDMVKQAPLKNIIKNINGNEVVFVGQSEDDDEPLDAKKDSDKKEAEVEKMAKRAAKK